MKSTNLNLIHQHRNIWAVGRNYIDHAIEMNAPIPDQKKDSPFFFLKSGNCLTNKSVIELPNWSEEIHHEIEIAYLVDHHLHFSHMTLALDLTARDKQSEAKKKGQPWTLSKSFRDSCPVGPWIPLSQFKTQTHTLSKNDEELPHFSFDLSINSNRTQSGHTEQMIFNPYQLLSYIKTHYPLQPQDIILSGTPSGVGKLRPGDALKAQLFRSTVNSSVNNFQDNSHLDPLLIVLWDIKPT